MSLKLEWDDASGKNLSALGPRLRPDEALNRVSEHERIGLPGRRVVVHDLLRRHAHPFDPGAIQINPHILFRFGILPAVRHDHFIVDLHCILVGAA